MLVLIKDITNKAHNKDKKAEGGSVFYGGKLNLDKKGRGKAKDKGNKAVGKNNNKKARLYKNYKNPYTNYKLDDCFVTNKKLRYE